MTNRLATELPVNSSSDTYAFPLAFAEQTLWFLQQLEPKSTTYDIPTAFRIVSDGRAIAVLFSENSHLSSVQQADKPFAWRAEEAT